MNNVRIERNIYFVGEQDGVAERILKSNLIESLSKNDQIYRAYLAQVRYGDLGPISVALAISCGTLAEVWVRETVNREFAKLFKTGEALDIIFLTDEEENKIKYACVKFFG